MTKAMPFLQKAILLSYDPRRFLAVSFTFMMFFLSRFELVTISSSLHRRRVYKIFNF